MGIFDRLLGRKPLPDSTSHAGAQQAVLVHLDAAGLPQDVYETCDLGTLEDRLIQVIESGQLGEFDGNEFGPGEVTLYMYSRDAEGLFAGIRETLRDYPLCQNARVVIRHGGPGAPERVVTLASATQALAADALRAQLKRIQLDVMGMVRIPVNSSDDDIRNIVVQWAELLAQEKYADALSMFLHTSESMGFEWTPEHLKDWISNYGCARADYDSGEYRAVTSMFDQPDPQEYIRKAIDVDRENLYGLDPAHYVGMVHFDDIPLDGQRSDLTARFHLKKIGEDEITLEFLDIHVM